VEGLDLLGLVGRVVCGRDDGGGHVVGQLHGPGPERGTESTHEGHGHVELLVDPVREGASVDVIEVVRCRAGTQHDRDASPECEPDEPLPVVPADLVAGLPGPQGLAHPSGRDADDLAGLQQVASCAGGCLDQADPVCEVREAGRLEDALVTQAARNPLEASDHLASEQEAVVGREAVVRDHQPGPLAGKVLEALDGVPVVQREGQQKASHAEDEVEVRLRRERLGHGGDLSLFVSLRRAGGAAGYGARVEGSVTLGPVWIAISALSWAASDALRKRLAGPMGPVALGWWLSVGSLPLFVAWVASSGAGAPDAGYWPWGLATFACTLAATLLMLAALAISELGVAVPMLALTPVFSALTAWLTLGEVLAWTAWGGVLLVVVGAVGLQLRGRRWAGDRGAWMMVGVALLWSLSAVFDKVAVGHASVPVHAAVQVGGSALVLGPWLVLRGRADALLPPRAHRGTAVLVVLAFGLALGSQLLALQLAPVSQVETVKRAVGPASAVVVGRLAFGEPLTAARILGVALMAVGSLLVLG